METFLTFILGGTIVLLLVTLVWSYVLYDYLYDKRDQKRRRQTEQQLMSEGAKARRVVHPDTLRYDRELSNRVAVADSQTEAEFPDPASDVVVKVDGAAVGRIQNFKPSDMKVEKIHTLDHEPKTYIPGRTETVTATLKPVESKPHHPEPKPPEVIPSYGGHSHHDHGSSHSSHSHHDYGSSHSHDYGSSHSSHDYGSHDHGSFGGHDH